MKKSIITMAIVASFAMRAMAWDFQSGNLLYTIISTEPPCVSLDGHIDGTEAQGELAIPEMVDYEGVSYTVTTIAPAAFLNCTGLSGSLVLPMFLTEIQEMAFMNCTGFTGTLDFPESLTQIKYAAFSGCTGFSGDLVIPNSVVEIGCTDYTSYYASGVYYSTFADSFSHLTLSESLDTIGMFCFWNCTRLEGDLVIPNSVKEIQRSAFENCTGFSGLTLGVSLTGIGTDAFANCVSFSGTLVIPESVTEINTRGFYYTGFNEIILPSSLRLSGSEFFSGCDNLTEIDIPEGWEKIGRNCFSDCSNLTTVHLPESLTEIPQGCFSHCTNLTNINFPEGIEFIDRQAFSHCFGLSGDLVISNSVEVVFPYAFDSCYNIRNVVLGSSINHFAEDSFRNIPLEKLVIKATTPPLMEHDLWQFPRDLLVIVPCGTLGVYQNAACWQDFTNMIEECNSLADKSSTDSQMFCYPNPTKDLVRIDVLNPTEVQVYNTLDQCVKTFQNTNEISLEGLPQGVYLLRVTLEDGKVFSDKVVKE